MRNEGCCIVKHNLCNTRLYGLWKAMKRRVAVNKYYKNVSICKEWEHDFKAFYDWAIANGYSDNLTLDRIDVNGNYEPSNCRWVTQKQQARNKRRTIYVETPDGIMTISEAAEKYNLEYACILYRYHQGMKGETLVSESSRTKAR